MHVSSGFGVSTGSLQTYLELQVSPLTDLWDAVSKLFSGESTLSSTAADGPGKPSAATSAHYSPVRSESVASHFAVVMLHGVIISRPDGHSNRHVDAIGSLRARRSPRALRGFRLFHPTDLRTFMGFDPLARDGLGEAFIRVPSPLS